MPRASFMPRLQLNEHPAAATGANVRAIGSTIASDRNAAAAISDTYTRLSEIH